MIKLFSDVVKDFLPFAFVGEFILVWQPSGHHSSRNCIQTQQWSEGEELWCLPQSNKTALLLGLELYPWGNFTPWLERQCMKSWQLGVRGINNDKSKTVIMTIFSSSTLFLSRNIRLLMKEQHDPSSLYEVQSRLNPGYEIAIHSDWGPVPVL